MKFKVGDKVEVLDANHNYEAIGKILDVVRADDIHIYLEGCPDPWRQDGSKLQLITNNKPNIMTTIKTYVKNLALSADEKLLRKHNLHNDCGENTAEAREAILEKFYNSSENQAYLLEIARGLEAEEK